MTDTTVPEPTPHSTAAPGAGGAPGVQFPLDDRGERSTGGLAREVVAAALGAVDPEAAARVHRTKDWRKGYIEHFTELVRLGVDDAAAWDAVARVGLETLQSRMVAVDPETGAETAMTEYLATARPRFAFETETIGGTGAPVERFELPYRGRRLHGAELRRHLEQWVERGVVEPSCAEALLEVGDHPEWLRLPGRSMLVLGLGSEMGPGRTLLRWGADVLGVDLPGSPVWDDLRRHAEECAGRLHVPVHEGRRGADLLTQLPELAAWVAAAAPAPVTVGTYLYADGGAHVRLSSAADALGVHLLEQGTADALAYLGTPMDTYVVPEDVRASANAAYDRTRALDPRAIAGRLSGRRMFHRNYAPGSGPGVHDALVPQQGPNYTLAKRVQRWRATTASAQGHTVSITVAPATNTRSVTKNKVLAYTYKGASAFDIEIFEPETSSTMLAALLVHDLSTPRAEVDVQWRTESAHAASGGLWRQPYLPRTALPVAALLGTVRR